MTDAELTMLIADFEPKIVSRPIAELLRLREALPLPGRPRKPAHDEICIVAKCELFGIEMDSVRLIT